LRNEGWGRNATAKSVKRGIEESTMKKKCNHERHEEHEGRI
jgi:hypothetical protein